MNISAINVNSSGFKQSMPIEKQQKQTPARKQINELPNAYGLVSFGNSSNEEDIKRVKESQANLQKLNEYESLFSKSSQKIINLMDNHKELNKSQKIEFNQNFNNVQKSLNGLVAIISTDKNIPSEYVEKLTDTGLELMFEVKETLDEARNEIYEDEIVGFIKKLIFVTRDNDNVQIEATLKEIQSLESELEIKDAFILKESIKHEKLLKNPILKGLNESFNPKI